MVHWIAVLTAHMQMFNTVDTANHIWRACSPTISKSPKRLQVIYFLWLIAQVAHNFWWTLEQRLVLFLNSVLTVPHSMQVLHCRQSITLTLQPLATTLSLSNWALQHLQMNIHCGRRQACYYRCLLLCHFKPMFLQMSANVITLPHNS